MKKFVIWFRANFTRAKIWRVTYDNGTRTRLLDCSEAYSLAEIFGGKSWIDYDAF